MTVYIFVHRDEVVTSSSALPVSMNDRAFVQPPLL